MIKKIIALAFITILVGCSSNAKNDIEIVENENTPKYNIQALSNIVGYTKYQINNKDVLSNGYKLNVYELKDGKVSESAVLLNKNKGDALSDALSIAMKNTDNFYTFSSSVNGVVTSNSIKLDSSFNDYTVHFNDKPLDLKTKENYILGYVKYEDNKVNYTYKLRDKVLDEFSNTKLGYVIMLEIK